MRGKLVVLMVISFAVAFSGVSWASQTISAVKTSTAPDLDGSDSDAVWKKATSYTIKDKRTGKDILLKAAYSNEMVYFLVSYPDKTKDDLHKPWVWNKELEVYEIGPQREDTFFFKWSMMDDVVDLSNFSDNNYTADAWYWKANRTNVGGFADDKSHVFSSEPGKKSSKITSRTGKTMYLMRLGDTGGSAYGKDVLVDYDGDIKTQYIPKMPEGSRADVKAKGVWNNNRWTIEFARKLDTGNDDDANLKPGSGSHLFGVSIKSCYGEPVNESASNIYGQGRISEPLYLTFE